MVDLSSSCFGSGRRGKERLEEKGTPAASGRAALLAVAGEPPAAGRATTPPLVLLSVRQGRRKGNEARV
jgi:hypothetical protein